MSSMSSAAVDWFASIAGLSFVLYRRPHNEIYGSASRRCIALRPNPTLNRTCNSVRRPGLISFWPGRRTLPHAG